MRPGRLDARSGRRLVILFAASVLLPASALAVLAWRSVEGEKRALAAEREGALVAAGRRIRRELAEEVERLRREEEARPFYQYNRLFYDANAVGKGSSFIPSPLAGPSPDPLVEGWFEIDPEGGVGSPGGEASRDAMRNAGQTLLPKMEEDLRRIPEPKQGQFAGEAGEKRTQNLSRKALRANEQARAQTAEILSGQVEDLPAEPGDDEPLEVVLSPVFYVRDAEGGVLGWRYADVPAARGPSFHRFVQGFRLDLDHLGSVLFPEIARRGLDVEGARAVLLPAGAAAPAGRVAFEEDPAPLPGFRVLVLDEDPDYVGRRVARLSLTLLAVAGGLLLVILTGLLFTARTVRQELDFARRKNDFVSAVTHELRTPLTGIRMYAEMLGAGWVKDEATKSDYVRFMAEETERLTRLVNRVLDFARAGRGPAALKPLDLAGPVREVERVFGPTLAARGARLAVEIVASPPALVDPDAVKQILLNLLENAAKYARPARDPTVTVRVAPEGAFVVLSVIDHGPGIPEPERDMVFLDFYRRGEELTREAPGTGLGLALVRRLAEASGGRAEVRETPGGGATFRVGFAAAGIGPSPTSAG
ncbi:MAG: HAMP domain-containing histidine kinase [Planctomycetes bacterium]|nr:HAMP domain-containing histidine kinase [Planctomycetota bacterium]